jgi:hypothetical protein
MSSKPTTNSPTTVLPIQFTTTNLPVLSSLYLSLSDEGQSDGATGHGSSTFGQSWLGR